MNQRFVKPFPKLRALMSNYDITYQQMANVIGVSYPTFSNRINARENWDFKFTEIIKAVEYINSYGENETPASLFFDWTFTKVS